MYQHLDRVYGYVTKQSSRLLVLDLKSKIFLRTYFLNGIENYV